MHQYLQNYNTVMALEYQNLIKFCLRIDLNRSMLGLLPVSFCIFTADLWPLILVRILFPLNILRTKN